MLTGFANVFGNRGAPTKAEQLPLACIWHMGDRTEPWGDANAGPPAFEHTLILAVDVMVKAASEDQLNVEITGLVEPLRLALLTDPSWLEMVDSVHRAEVRYSYPDEGTFIYARGVVEFELKFSSQWLPAVPNDLREVAVMVGAGSGAFAQSFALPGTVS